MSRQAQNMILGGLAFAVGIVGMVAVFLLMTGGDGTTTAGAPLSPGTQAEGGTETSADGSAAGGAGSEGLTGTEPSTVEPLAVPATPSTEAPPLITTSTTLVITTVAPTTAPPTTEAVTTTEAPTETTAAETDTTMSDTTMSDTTEAPSDTEAPTSTEPSDESTPTSEGEETTTTTAPTTESTEAPTGGLNDIEREIARLTNELRTNPNGPMRREGPVINCNGRVGVTDGQYDAIGAVEISEVASIQVARPWSAQMTTRNFKHQANAGVPALQSAGISVRSAGENIAYHSYADKAMTHFTGWRESDGHFCNMMDPGFTHLGVGEVSKDDGISYATQNFFSTR